MKYTSGSPFFFKNDINYILKEYKKILSGKGSLRMGKFVKQFEKKFSEYIGVKNSISTTSCTAALETIFNTINLKKNDEVIIPCQTYIASGSTALRSQAKPIVAEIDDDFNLSFEATAGAPVPQIENGYIVKDDQDKGFYIDPHGYLDENLNKQSLDAVITPTKNLELPLIGSFVKGADVIPKLINKFNPKYILSSTVGGDAKYSGFLNNFISVQDYEEELDCKLVDLKSMQSIMI